MTHFQFYGPYRIVEAIVALPGVLSYVVVVGIGEWL